MRFRSMLVVFLTAASSAAAGQTAQPAPAGSASGLLQLARRQWDAGDPAAALEVLRQGLEGFLLLPDLLL